MKFNHLVDDASETFQGAQVVNFADPTKQAQLHARFSQLKSQYTNYFKKF